MGAPARSAYIVGPASDGLWLLACPLLALGAMHAAWAWSGLSDSAIYLVLFAFIVTGHHMPGWLRAFGEPTVYQQHKARLWVAFAAVPALVILPTALGLGGLAILVAGLFDLWHVSMQQHGFGRIYAAKEGDGACGSARIDLFCVLVWYVTLVAWSDAWTHMLAVSFRRVGLPALSALDPAAWLQVKTALLAASGAGLALYLGAAVRLWLAERRFASRKHALHAVAFGVLAWTYRDPSWFRAQSVVNLFHALQYFFIVWAFSRLSIRRDPERPRAFYRLLFASRWGLLPYAGAIGIYGLGGLYLGDYLARSPGDARGMAMAEVAGSIGVASLLLHFYVDSFIWKVRTGHVRRALDLGGGAQAAAPSRGGHLRAAAHAGAYFGLPLVVLAVAGGGKDVRQVPPQVLAREAELYPRSAQARFLHGMAALGSGDRATARRELDFALALAPELEGPAWWLADLDRREGRPELELAHLEAARRASPSRAMVCQSLGWALVRRGRIADGEALLRRAVDLEPRSARAHLELGRFFLLTGQPARAVPPLARVLELNPANSEAACALAEAHWKSGRPEPALAALRAFLAGNPRDRAAREMIESIARNLAQDGHAGGAK